MLEIMRVRGIAAALSVFLAVVSSWASACDLSCSLQRIAAGCDDRAAGPHCGRSAQAKNSEALRTADEMPGMPDMPGMRSSQGDARTESISPVVHDGQPCSRSSVSASAAAETSRYEFKGVAFVAVPVVSIAAPVLAMGGVNHEVPPPRSAANNPLPISLRI